MELLGTSASAVLLTPIDTVRTVLINHQHKRYHTTVADVIHSHAATKSL